MEMQRNRICGADIHKKFLVDYFRHRGIDSSG
jgi:hypothetical protein